MFYTIKGQSSSKTHINQCYIFFNSVVSLNADIFLSPYALDLTKHQIPRYLSCLRIYFSVVNQINVKQTFFPEASKRISKFWWEIFDYVIRICVFLEICDREEVKKKQEELSADMEYHRNFQKVIALRNHNKV